MAAIVLMILNFALAFAAGAVAKIADGIADGQLARKPKWIGLACGALFGLLLGLAASNSPELCTIFVAAAIGNLLAGKFDSRQHHLAIAVFFAIIFFNGLQAMNAALLLLFGALAFFDEAMNDLSDKAWGKRGMLRKALGARLLLEAGALMAGFALGNFNYFFGILAFDIAYGITARAMGKSEIR